MVEAKQEMEKADYQERWFEHTKELVRLGHYLNFEEFSQLKELQEKLDKLIITASEHREKFLKEGRF